MIVGNNADLRALKKLIRHASDPSIRSDQLLCQSEARSQTPVNLGHLTMLLRLLLSLTAKQSNQQMKEKGKSKKTLNAGATGKSC